MLVKNDTGLRLLKYVSDGPPFGTYTSALELAELLSIPNREAVGLCQALARCGFGRYVTGRRDHPTRIEWSDGHPKAIAIHDAMNWLESRDAETPLPDTPSSVADIDQPLSIAEAKRRLALNFGIAPENIEIVIRA